MTRSSRILRSLSFALGLAPITLLLCGLADAAQQAIPGPPGSGRFGRGLTVLPNGNFVVIDDEYDAPGPVPNVGAVYLYGPDGELISTLRGSTANDRVGFGGIQILTNGNYVIQSPYWSNGSAASAGAATFASAATGVEGVVSASNSLVSLTGGAGLRVVPLKNGNYVVSSPTWSDGPVSNVGAATFGSGSTGISGTISISNSLVGSIANSRVGAVIFPLANGDYVVLSPDWESGPETDVGAVTRGSGTTGVKGLVSPANSLIGSTRGDSIGRSYAALGNSDFVLISGNWTNSAGAKVGAVTFFSGTAPLVGTVSATNSLIGSSGGDAIGSGGVVLLSNGNYVVNSPRWDNGLTGVDAGAVTLALANGSTRGEVSSFNSLVGTKTNDSVGIGGITVLPNGRYVVSSYRWNSESALRVGAATWAPASGIVGAVSAGNSLVGSQLDDGVGFSMTVLANGNYVAASRSWNNGNIPDAGSVTLGLASGGLTGPVSAANSLVGGSFGDFVGIVTALTNGNYVVQSPEWNLGSTADVGAVTFRSGTGSPNGLVSAANSLTGSASGDTVGSGGIRALTTGNYVVASPNWRSGSIVHAGAVTFVSGSNGLSGAVSTDNSLTGAAAESLVGNRGVCALANGNFVVLSSEWSNGAVASVGAATLGNGQTGIAGIVSAANSMVGTSAGDRVGNYGLSTLSNGNYLLYSDEWDNGPITDAGAITLGLGAIGITGPLTPDHSVFGLVNGAGFSTVVAYDPLRNQLIVGQPASNRVVLQRSGVATTIQNIVDTPDPSTVGQPVIVAAMVSAATAPIDGQVQIVASSGESCMASTPITVSATTAQFSCTLTFSALGNATINAEYIGSVSHAYSGRATQLHVVVADAPLFANGFE